MVVGQHLRVMIRKIFFDRLKGREKNIMIEKEKLAMLAELFELDEGVLSADTVLADVDEYDSMAKLSLIVLMDDEFGVKVTGDMIKGFKTVGDILILMKK